jgi:signal transduction histidine kinase/ligand-binding sensor domain-containing protein
MNTDFYKIIPFLFRVQTSVCKFRRASRSEKHARTRTLNKAKNFLNIANSLIFILIFASLTSLSQTSPEPPPSAQNFHQWGAVTLFNGLPSDNVRAITQTPDGILWFGTDGGLARFDGRRVQIFGLQGLSSNKILTLETSVTGEIWIGTDAGAGRFYDGSFSPIPETVGKPITSILLGEITTLVSTDTIFSAHHNPDNSLQIIASEPNDLQFVAAARINEHGLIYGSNGRGLIIKKDEFQEVSSRPRPFFVNALKADGNGDLWIGAKSEKGASGLFWAKDIFRPVRLGEGLETVTAFGIWSNGDFWVGTEKHGLFHFRGTQQLENYTFENTSGGLRSNKIYAVFVDREGVLWLGTNRGACRFDASSPFNQMLSEDSNANFVRTIYPAADGQIYAGTNRGLYLFSGGNWLAANNFPPKTIYAVGESGAKQILIGTSNGLFGLDGKQISPGDFRAVVVFQGKTYAAIFGRGIVQLENQISVFANDSPTALYADGGKLWIGTAKDGVYAFDGKETKQEAAFNDLRGSAIRRITKDAANNFWLTGERGLFLYRGGELKNILPNQDVRDVAITGADVWAATLKDGLFHLRFDDVFGWLTSDINVEQGLPSEQIFSILPVENRLLIGTNRGVVNYAPSAVAPQIVATRVLSRRLHNADELYQTIALDYPQNSLLVEVAGLSSRTFPEQFQYEFTLKNSKGEIIESKLSSDAQFSPTNLAAGAYRIEARSFNKDLLASDSLIIEFSVAAAPFPLTATALGVLLFIALIALIWAIVERRRIVQKNRELAAARFDLANEAERERKRIAQDLHDQTLADLRNLMLMSDKLPADNSEFRTEIESVSTEIRRICEDLSPSVLENVGLTPALEFLLSHTIENHEFSAAENLEDKLHFSANEQMQIYRIAQEVLNNIKRHSDAKRVEMKIEVSPENVFILGIRDDGAYFNPEEITAKNRGIANIKSRVSLIKAQAVWQKSSGGGTEFLLLKNI